MKKLILLFLVLSLFSCSNNSNEYQSDYYQDQENNNTFIEPEIKKDNNNSYNNYEASYGYDEWYEWAESNDIDNFDDCQYEFNTSDAEDWCNEYVKENYTWYQTFWDYNCTEDCSWHEAWYEWAESNDIDDEYDCDWNSNSFNEWCMEYIEENY